MTRIKLILLLLYCVPMVSFSQSADTVKYGKTGIYLDYKDKKAVDLAKELSDVVFTIVKDTSNENGILLTVKNIAGLFEALPANRKNSIGAELSLNVSACESELLEKSVGSAKTIAQRVQEYYLWLLQNGYEGNLQTESQIADEMNQFHDYLRGKVKSDRFDRMYFPVMGYQFQKKNPVEEISFRINLNKEPLLHVRYDTLYGVNMKKFPVMIKNENCGNSENTVLPAEPAFKDIVRTETFELSFEKNSTVPEKEEINSITDFLRKENLAIYSASIEGFASVEGSQVINERLYRKRAEVMVELLEQNNENKIIIDTVISVENWKQFEMDLKDGPHRWLLDLSRQDIKLKLENDSLVNLLETTLARHRKARLTLNLVHKVTENQTALPSKATEMAELNQRIFNTLKEQLWITHLNPAGKGSLERDFEVIFRLLQKLEEDVSVCREEIENLRLNFNLFLLQNLNTSGQTRVEGKIVLNAYQEILRYALERVKTMDMTSLTALSMQLNLFEFPQYGISGSSDAWRLIHSAEKAGREFTEDQLLWYYRLAYYKLPTFNSKLLREKRFDMRKLFSGTFNLYPYGAVKSKLCE